MKHSIGSKINKFKEPALIIIFGLVFLLPFYRSDFYISHDSEPQVARSAAVFRALSDGQIPPRWAGELNYAYGVPSPNFFFPMMGYLISLIHISGFSLESSYKIVMGLAFIFSGLAFYLWISKGFKKVVAFGSAIVYMLAPYHFLNMFVRGQLGEMLAFVFAPLVLYFIDKYSEKGKSLYIVFGSIGYACLVISHNILALLFSIILGFYILSFTKNVKLIVKKCLILFLGLTLSAYFWVPALLEGKYINSKIFVGNYFSEHFIKLENLIYAPWGFGSNINEVGGLSPYVGIVQVLLVLVALFAMRVKNNKKAIIFWLSIFIISVFFTNELSSFMWTRFHILEQFQFPWRFIAISSFAASVLAAYSLNYLKKDIFVYLIIAVILITSSFYVQVRGYTKNDDSFYLDYSGTGAYHGESTTIWTAGDASAYPDSPVEVISGRGQILDYKRKSNIHEFTVFAEDSVKVKDNTVYYPGWRVFVNGEDVPVEFQDPNHRGLITFDVPKGNYDVEIKFTETILRKTTNLVSFISFIFVILIIIFRDKFDKLILRR